MLNFKGFIYIYIYIYTSLVYGKLIITVKMSDGREPNLTFFDCLGNLVGIMSGLEKILPLILKKLTF